MDGHGTKLCSDRRITLMKCFRMILLLFAVCALGSNLRKTPDDKDDLKALKGVWLVSVVESNGVKVSPDDAKWDFVGDKYTVKVGTQIQEGTAKVESAKNPKRIDLSVLSGNDKGLTYQGIFKIVDDELLLCFPKDTKAERPTEFSGNAGNGQTLMVLKRKK
jgi:uncharacterized protein (TIGR03067 family)